MLLKGKVGLVTGGASGIGEAIAKRMAAEGASVLVADLDEAGGTRVSAEIGDVGGAATFQRTDVSSEESVKSMVDMALKTYGRLDLAANNAGIPQSPILLHEVDVALWDRIVGINEKGMFLCLRAEISAMLESGGAIVNTVSTAGLKAIPQLGAYTASKHSVVGITKQAAIDYIQCGIRVNGVAPGVVNTPLVQALPEHERRAYAARTPIGRLIEPGEIASAVIWLMSDDSSQITGSILAVDGGQMLL